MKFLYASGQRPLDGYTIKRGIGCGGFGEVYFGVSDSGKEVALKCIRQNLDIELRGINQCLNLKHPHLVHLYDLKKDANGDHWLIMEYVSGESLAAVLNRFPNGLPHDLVGQWFSQLASAVHYLHDNGIVHRDLKPANIFLENGLVKVGDYGLCKFISGSQHQEQTQNIGTVHYMAPEISTGNYRRQVDVYAAGILLHEMLTGKVPFDGESAAEILMKHLTAKPNLTGAPAAFVPILEKALHKNPLLRYATMAEMGKEVAQAAAPNELRPVVVPVTMTASTSAPMTLPAGEIRVPLGETQVYAPRFGGVQLLTSLLSALGLALVFSMAWALLFQAGDWRAIAPAFFLTAACSLGVLLAGRLWVDVAGDTWQRRAALTGVGAAVGLLAIWLDGFPVLGGSGGDWHDLLAPLPRTTQLARDPIYDAFYPENHTLPVLASWLGYFGGMLLVLGWWKATSPRRSHRFSAQVLLATCFWAYIFLFLLPTAHERQIGFATMAMTSAVVQLASPCRQVEPPRGKRLRLKYA